MDDYRIILEFSENKWFWSIEKWDEWREPHISGSCEQYENATRIARAELEKLVSGDSSLFEYETE